MGIMLDNIELEEKNSTITSDLFQKMSSCSFLLPKTYSTKMILGMVTGGRFLRSLPISRALINILCACAWSPARVARGTDMLISRENSRARDSHWGLIPF